MVRTLLSLEFKIFSCLFFLFSMYSDFSVNSDDFSVLSLEISGIGVDVLIFHYQNLY